MAATLFQCRLSAELIALVNGIIHHADDHVILFDLGVGRPRDAEGLGKTYCPAERAPIIV